MIAEGGSKVLTNAAELTYFSVMLKPSRLYSFLDVKQGFALHFLDGQKLIHDLALIHGLTGQGFAYFRDTVLSALSLISFLRPGESLGIYVDSETPYCRLKIETSHTGRMRTLLLPENFSHFPMAISGVARVTKQFPSGKAPYTSVVQFEEMATNEVINKVLQTSYQANAEMVVSEAADQSFMLIKLPPVNVNVKTQSETVELAEYLKQHRSLFHSVFDERHNDVENIVKAFEQSSFGYLSSRLVEFYCPCSKERMMDNLRMMNAKDPEALFAGEAQLEAKCDYCQKKYTITRAELSAPFNQGPLN